VVKVLGGGTFSCTGVEFLDAPDERQRNARRPPLHHFHSHTPVQSDSWNECLAEQVTIPHHVLKNYEEDGTLAVSSIYRLFGR